MPLFQSDKTLTALFGCCMAGATWNCCRLGASSVYTFQPCTSWQCHFIQSHIGRLLLYFERFQLIKNLLYYKMYWMFYVKETRQKANFSTQRQYSSIVLLYCILRLQAKKVPQVCNCAQIQSKLRLFQGVPVCRWDFVVVLNHTWTTTTTTKTADETFNANGGGGGW